MPSPSSAPPRRRTAAAVAATALALTGACRVDVSVGIDADADGTGRVRAAALLDADAVDRLVGEAAGDPATSDPATRIKVDDLRSAGWTVTTPRPTSDGGLEVVVTHPFDDATEARRLLSEIAGEAGPFRDVTLRQERSFFKTSTDFRGTIDLGAGLGAFTDPELRKALEATDEAPLGITEEQLEQRLGEAVERMFGLQVAVRLPGRVTSNAPTETGDAAVWAPSLGEEVVLEASSERWNVANVLAAAVAVLGAVALVLVVGTQRRRRGRGTPSDLTVTDSNLTVGSDGTPGTDRGGA